MLFPFENVPSGICVPAVGKRFLDSGNQVCLHIVGCSIFRVGRNLYPLPSQGRKHLLGGDWSFVRFLLYRIERLPASSKKVSSFPLCETDIEPLKEILLESSLLLTYVLRISYFSIYRLISMIIGMVGNIPFLINCFFSVQNRHQVYLRLKSYLHPKN